MAKRALVENGGYRLHPPVRPLGLLPVVDKRLLLLQTMTTNQERAMTDAMTLASKGLIMRSPRMALARVTAERDHWMDETRKAQARIGELARERAETTQPSAGGPRT